MRALGYWRMPRQISNGQEVTLTVLPLPRLPSGFALSHDSQADQPDAEQKDGHGLRLRNPGRRIQTLDRVIAAIHGPGETEVVQVKVEAGRIEAEAQKIGANDP